jgi:homoserine kinase type II
MDLHAALARWDLGAVRALEEVQGGSVNRVFRAVTERGTMYLRVYRTKELEVVQREHALIAYVARTELPAVVPVASRAGETALWIDETPCALYPEADGAQVGKRELGTDHAAMAGRMLARLHACLAELPDAGYRRFTLRWPRRAWIERLAAIARAISERAEPSEADARVLRRLDAQRAWLADERCAHEYTPSAQPQVIHGDYQHENLFFAAGEVSAVIDWEQASFMPRAYEIVRAAAYMFDAAPEPTHAFVQAYRSVLALSDEELDDGARAWGCMSDHYVWALEEVYLHGNERARRFIPDGFRPFEEMWP